MNTETRTEKSPASNGRPPRVAATPDVDVYESTEEYLVVADVPGVCGDALEVEFEGDELRVRAPQSEEDTASEPLEFKKTFHVPNVVDPNAIEADLNDGVLTVRLKKRASARPRKIEVRQPN